MRAPHGVIRVRCTSRGEKRNCALDSSRARWRQRSATRSHARSGCGDLRRGLGSVARRRRMATLVQAGALAARAMSRRSPKAVVTCARSAESRDATARDAKMRS
ncbi:hypothetical protein MTO96_023641 [Rhipicephalus appendiculatus]